MYHVCYYWYQHMHTEKHIPKNKFNWIYSYFWNMILDCYPSENKTMLLKLKYQFSALVTVISAVR